MTPAPRHLQTSGPLWPLSLEKGRENNCSKRKQPGEANPGRSTAGRKQGQDDVSMSQLQTIIAFCFRMKSRYSVFKPLPRNSPQKGACLFFSESFAASTSTPSPSFQLLKSHGLIAWHPSRSGPPSGRPPWRSPHVSTGTLRADS